MLKRRKPRETHPDHQKILDRIERDEIGVYIKMPKSRHTKFKERLAKNRDAMGEVLNNYVLEYIAKRKVD